MATGNSSAAAAATDLKTEDVFHKKGQNVVKIAANGKICETVETAETFESLNLKEGLLNGLHAMGIATPTELQKTALPQLLSNPPSNKIVTADTDSGKMVTCALAMLNRVNTTFPFTQCVCVAPSNELVIGIGQLTAKMAKYIPAITIGYIFEESDYAVLETSKNLVSPESVHILIGMPQAMRSIMSDIIPQTIDIFVVYRYRGVHVDGVLDSYRWEPRNDCVIIKRVLREDCQTVSFIYSYAEKMFAQRVAPNSTIIHKYHIEDDALEDLRTQFDQNQKQATTLLANRQRVASRNDLRRMRLGLPLGQPLGHKWGHQLGQQLGQHYMAPPTPTTRPLGQHLGQQHYTPPHTPATRASATKSFNRHRNFDGSYIDFDRKICAKVNEMLSKIHTENASQPVVPTNDVKRDSIKLNSTTAGAIKSNSEKRVESHAAKSNAVAKDRKPSAFDSRLKRELLTKQTSPKYKRMLGFRKKLPAYDMKEEILKTIARNQVVVLSGETGCGKTTQVPQFILDDYISRGEGSNCSVVCTQPRRISAISVAQRVSDERGEKCGNGESCGYLIRLEKYVLEYFIGQLK